MSNDERGTNISMTSADKGDTKTLKKTRNDLKKNYKHDDHQCGNKAETFYKLTNINFSLRRADRL